MTEPRSSAAGSRHASAVPTEHVEDVEPTGHFRVYLGAAAGVGKTYAMLNEAHRRQQRGTDVVIGFIEKPWPAQHGAVDSRVGGGPPQQSNTGAPLFEEMDLEACLNATPRWRSSTSSLTRTYRARVTTRSAGKMSWSCSTRASMSYPTVNIQHLESIADAVEQITGVQSANESRLGTPKGGPDRTGRLLARTAASTHAPRQHLSAREGARGPDATSFMRTT